MMRQIIYWILRKLFYNKYNNDLVNKPYEPKRVNCSKCTRAKKTTQKKLSNMKWQSGFTNRLTLKNI